MKTSTTNVSVIISLVLRAMALAMAVAAFIMNILDVAEVNTLITMLCIGLFTLALDALDSGQEPE